MYDHVLAHELGHALFNKPNGTAIPQPKHKSSDPYHYYNPNNVKDIQNTTNIMNDSVGEKNNNVTQEQCKIARSSFLFK